MTCFLREKLFRENFRAKNNEKRAANVDAARLWDNVWLG
jgi:hypothetical protein